MTDDKKPRELTHESIQWVPKKAYDALAKENEELKVKTTQMSDVIEEYVKQITSLRESLKLAIEALTIISGKHETLCVDDLEDARFDAEQTLAKIKGEHL